MNLMIDELDIRNIIKKSDELAKYIQKSYKVQLVNNSYNKVFRIKGNNEIFAKVGFGGWGKYEFNTLQKLIAKNYRVPKPITFISMDNELNGELKYGELAREVGLLFYFPLKGEDLKHKLTNINILNALNFLKKLHEDKSLINGIIKNYQNIEVTRGLEYIQKFFKEKFAKDLQEMMKKYQDLEIDYCFIHGGPRLDHFIIKDGQIGMIDFEGACAGDPFKDLGILMTELLFSKIKKQDLIKNYFNRDLSKEEQIRLQFFELRAL